jgi:N-acetylated-alpha-linked acidic dipeptidase
MLARHTSIGLVLLVLAGSTPAHSQHQSMPGFAAVSAERQRALETSLVAGADTAELRRHVRTLGAWARVAGSPGSSAAAEYVLEQFASFGLEPVRSEFEVYLPHQDSAVVELLRPPAEGGRVRLSLEEPPVAGDPESTSAAWPVLNGFSGVGDVQAPLVYVNFGLPADYRTLDSLGVSARGAIVIARYGGSFRGIKAREAERHGAVALILYSDPAEDGFTHGDVYPMGPMRSPDGVQRGSLNNRAGDASTPDWTAADGRHLPDDSLLVPRLPVVPVGYRNAAVLLSGIATGAIPQAWQGGLPFRYHTGPGTARVRVAVWAARGPRARRTIVNALGVLRGSEFPDELVVVGAHRDSWGPGAADNASGTASVLEAARLLGVAARQGMRPRRSIVFATWDAEEWGLIGSTEWGEREADRLTKHAVAYVNQDMPAFGKRFGAAASPTLAGMLRDVAALVRQPGDTMSVLAAWRSAAGDSVPPVGDLTGGSDFAVFYNHLGIASIGFGFGGPMGVYHSAYDTPSYMERFGDPGYRSHRAAATLTAVLVARLANADVVPFDFAAWGGQVLSFVREARTRAGARANEVGFAALEQRATDIARLGEELLSARDRAVARGTVTRAALSAANTALRQVERSLVRPGGIPDRPWMQNVLLASDRNDGYGKTPLPGITEALVDGDLARARAQADAVAEGLDRARRAIEDARQALK